ncbi:MAG: hypothetical protein IPJ94_16395 [Chloroflexi bacterium]|nr:hypothetical protein [Chloroflexota bacterium]
MGCACTVNGTTFRPEEVSGAILATELAVDLVARGHIVSFVTCAPNHPQGKIFPGYTNSLLAREIWQGVQLVRTWSYISPPTGFWRRIFNYGTFSTTAFYGGLVAGRPDVIFSYSPPLPLGVAAWALSRLWRVPWVLRVEDLYPDAAVAAGVLQNQRAIRFFMPWKSGCISGPAIFRLFLKVFATPCWVKVSQTLNYRLCPSGQIRTWLSRFPSKILFGNSMV